MNLLVNIPEVRPVVFWNLWCGSVFLWALLISVIYSLEWRLACDPIHGSKLYGNLVVLGTKQELQDGYELSDLWFIMRHEEAGSVFRKYPLKKICSLSQGKIISLLSVFVYYHSREGGNPLKNPLANWWKTVCLKNQVKQVMRWLVMHQEHYPVIFAHP